MSLGTNNASCITLPFTDPLSVLFIKLKYFFYKYHKKNFHAGNIHNVGTWPVKTHILSHGVIYNAILPSSLPSSMLVESWQCDYCTDRNTLLQ